MNDNVMFLGQRVTKNVRKMVTINLKDTNVTYLRYLGILYLNSSENIHEASQS